MKQKIKFRLTQASGRSEKLAMNLAEGEAYEVDAKVMELQGASEGLSPRFVFGIRKGRLEILDWNREIATELNGVKLEKRKPLKAGDLVGFEGHQLEILVAPTWSQEEQTSGENSTKFVDVATLREVVGPEIQTGSTEVPKLPESEASFPRPIVDSEPSFVEGRSAPLPVEERSEVREYLEAVRARTPVDEVPAIPAQVTPEPEVPAPETEITHGIDLKKDLEEETRTLHDQEAPKEESKKRGVSRKFKFSPRAQKFLKRALVASLVLGTLGGVGYVGYEKVQSAGGISKIFSSSTPVASLNQTPERTIASKLPELGSLDRGIPVSEIRAVVEKTLR